MIVPKKITPCPIVDCVIELRFHTSIEPGAIFGIVYNAFKGAYPNVEKLALLNIPEQIRITDPNLIYQPWYRLRNGGFHLSTGARVLSLGRSGEYPGWSPFSERLQDMIATLDGLSIADAIERVGLRYINFFDFDIFDRIKLDVSINGASITGEDTLVRATILGNRYRSLLHVSNRASIMIEGTNRTGSIVDIDTWLEADFKDFFHDSTSAIEEGHSEEKQVFFGLLKDDFLQTLKPEY